MKPKPTAAPAAPDTLESITAAAQAANAKLEKRGEDLKYDLVLSGLWFLKAQAFHALPPANRRQGRKSSPPADNMHISTDEGFHAWLFSHFPGMAPNRAHERINLALNLGLTPESDPAAVEELRAAEALKGRSVKALYVPPHRLNPPASSSGSTAQEDPAEVAQQLVFPLWDTLMSAETRVNDTHLFQLPEVSSDPQKPSLSSMEMAARRLLDRIAQIRSERKAL